MGYTPEQFEKDITPFIPKKYFRTFTEQLSNTYIFSLMFNKGDEPEKWEIKELEYIISDKFGMNILKSKIDKAAYALRIYFTD